MLAIFYVPQGDLSPGVIYFLPRHPYNDNTARNGVFKVSDKKIAMSYRYNVEMVYLDNANGKNKKIKNECLKTLIIDHNYEVNCMPVLYADLKLDRSLIDNMIANVNKNLMMIALNKYDELTDDRQENECFRKKFIYFLPNTMNVTDPVDYNEDNEEETHGDTYSTVTIGFLALDHVNNNKQSLEIACQDNTIYDCVKYCTSHIPNLIIEPFTYNDQFDQIIMPTQDSVNKALKFLNNFRVFYNTPYRYYQDFNYTYIISSSGKAISRPDEVYSTVIIDIRDITDEGANEVGVMDNKSSQTYQVFVNYVDTQALDNSMSNKSRTAIKGVNTDGSTKTELTSTSDYSRGDKTTTLRINNDNKDMLKNMVTKSNNSNFYVYFNKTGLDTTLFSINKRISIHNISRYQEFNGDYLLSRKRELYSREDDTFTLLSMINLNRVDRSVNQAGESTTLKLT